MLYNENKDIIEGLFIGMLKRAATPAEIIVHADMIGAGFKVSDIINLILNCEEYINLSKAKLFVPPGHFYSPIVNTQEAARYLDKHQKYETELHGVDINHEDMVKLWTEISRYLCEYPFSGELIKPYRYATNNNNFGYGDSAILFAMMRHFQPKRFLEVGSGWSSACAMDTADEFLSSECNFTFVEPFPSLLRTLIGKAANRTKILEMGVQDVEMSQFEELDSGDFLFIDSTHVVRTGSDVCFEVFEVLPRLKKGVIVHIHDMFWPFEYPRHWILEDNRSWNELYLIRAMLMNSTAWEVLYFNHYFAIIESQRLAKECPRILENSGGGLWIRKN